MRGRVSVGRGESAGGETCPCGGERARGEGGDLTCLTRAVIKRVRCGDTRHDDQTFAETCQVLCAGQNRQGVMNESFIQSRSSEPD